MRFLVLGGGCYGTFYARQLLRARDAGALDTAMQVVVVDRNAEPPARTDLPADPALTFVVSTWDDFLDRALAGLPPDADDRVVPSPFTPHLALGWVLRRLERQRPGWSFDLEPFGRMPGTPYQLQRERGPLLVSHADWTCPVHCIEPATCPHTGGPRFWDLDRTVRTFTHALEEGGQPVEQVHLFHCRHLTHGVGVYPAAEIPAAAEGILALLAAEGAHRVLVGTVSHCHGALHLLRCTPPAGARA